MGWPVTGFTFPGLSPGEQCDSTSDNDDSPPLPTLNITQLSGSLAVHALSPSTSSIESEKVRDKRPIRYKKDKNRNPAQRKAHNAIEKRYRENLKTKFAALERATCGITGFSSVPLRKSTILSNAILHIEEMEDKNKKLEKELKALRKRVGSSPLEIL
ncbi:hypothetical protein BJX63DRAFT_364524 [Aspergillus granulosus]|uniref:BHLH domain-containing protein n=1 Tax=Aspergillus granulosus TaxID=176169 RepID=A0ABR4H1R2_9EURO